MLYFSKHLFLIIMPDEIQLPNRHGKDSCTINIPFKVLTLLQSLYVLHLIQHECTFNGLDEVVLCSCTRDKTEMHSHSELHLAGKTILTTEEAGILL